MSCARGCCATQLEHYRSVRLSATCTPTRSGNYQQTQAIEDGWKKDLPAYKRMVDAGIQPDTVDGAHEMEQKVDAHDGQVADVD